MTQILSLSTDMLSRLYMLAQQEDCSVDELLGRLLDGDAKRTDPSEQRYHQLFLKSHVTQLLIDPATGHILDANPAALNFYGYSYDTIRTLSIQDINALTEPEVRAEMRRARDRERSFFQFQHRLASGEVRHVDVYSGPAELDGRVVLHSIVVDATERWKLQAALVESEARLRTMADFNTDWTYWEKPDGSLHYISPACETITGYPPQAFYEDPALLPGMVHPDDRAAWQAHRHPSTDDAHARTLLFRILNRHGELRWIEHHCRPIFQRGGAFDGYRVGNRDITEQKVAQARAFELMLEQERLQMLNTFIEGAAHEFRTPLSIINMQAYIMQRSHDPDRRLQALTRVQEQVAQISHLVEMLLLSSKLDQKVASCVPVDLTALVRDVCRAAQVQRGPDAPSLHLLPIAHQPMVQALPMYAQQALVALLDNAYRFTPPDGRIEVSVDGDAREVWVSVTDTGPGIRPQDLAQVFEAFWRGDTAHSTPGLGLGLTIARRIARACDGEVSVTSRPGQGSTFTLRLPRA